MHPSLLAGDDGGLARGPCVAGLSARRYAGARSAARLPRTRRSSRAPSAPARSWRARSGRGGSSGWSSGPIRRPMPGGSSRSPAGSRRPAIPAQLLRPGDVGRPVLRRPGRRVPAPGRAPGGRGRPAPLHADGSWRLAMPARGPAPRLVVRRLTAAPRAPRPPAGRSSPPCPAGERFRRRNSCAGPGRHMATLRRMADAGLIAIDAARSRPPMTSTGSGCRCRAAPPTDPGSGDGVAGASPRRSRRAARRRCCCTGSPGRARPRCICGPWTWSGPQGRGAIVLVPEISLTPQLLSRLRARLGPGRRGLALQHDARRAGTGRRATARRATPTSSSARAARCSRRSATSASIVVDEEHDASYKQDSTPRYDARQVAFRRGRDAGALVRLRLGDAAPGDLARTRAACSCGRGPTGRSRQRCGSSTCAPSGPGRSRRRWRAPCAMPPSAATRPCSCSTAAGSR